MCALYGHLRYFKSKQKYLQYGPCFQTIFSLLMTMDIWKDNIHVKFSYFIKNGFFTGFQCGFLPDEKLFDESPLIDVTGIFLDISMKFEKVWHEALVCKLKSHGISGNLLKLIENYLIDRKQRVVLNDKTSSWKRVLSGIPRGSVLEPLLLLIYINDVPNDIKSICKIFADYTSWFPKCEDF